MWNKDKNNLKKEINSIPIYTGDIKTPVIKCRIDHLLDWYIRKATFYKNLFYLLSIITIVINTSIPVISQLEGANKDIIVSIISSIAAVITSILALFTMKDTWFRYRNHTELIKQECIKCIAKIDDYQNEDNEKILIKRVESIISDERMLWNKSKFNKKE